MKIEKVLNYFSHYSIKARDNIIVRCNDGNSYFGRILERKIIVGDNHEILKVIHCKDGRNCLYLKNRPDGFGPDTVDKLIFLDDIIDITKP